MYSRKINLPYFHKLILLLFAIYSHGAYGQKTVSVTIGNGKVEKSNLNISASSLFTGRSSGELKTFIVTGNITLAITTIQTSCGYSNGSIIVLASGGVAPYTYTISSGLTQNTGNFTSLAAGSYAITVVDASGETTTTTVTLINSIPTVVLNVSSYQYASGCATADASVTLVATGGTPPYQYSLDMVNYQTSNTFTNLYPGFYLFFVRDANGCLAAYSAFNISDLFSPNCTVSFGVSWSQLICFNNGTIHIDASGPGGPYTYSIDGINYLAVGNFNNLSPGIYILYYRSITGAVYAAAVPIYPYCNVNIDYISVDAACQQNDGSLNIITSNGSPPYTYTVDGINYQASNVFTGLAPGNYTVTVKDINGVTNSLRATVYDRCPTVTLSSTGESCTHNDGSITATATKGTPPYQYSIDGVNFQSSNIFTGLVVGVYIITIKDALGFTSGATITVNNSCLTVTAVAVNSTCGNNNGKITASAGSGTPPYQYSINGVNFQSSNIFIGLPAGPYTITTKDINSNIGTTTVSIFNTPGPQIVIASSPASCTNNGSITIAGIGGTLPFQFSIDGNNYQSNNVYNNLIAGNYTAWIRDANGCLAMQAIIVSMDCPVVTVVATNETCHGGNGSIIATAVNGTPPYKYSIDGINFQTNNIFSGLAAGTYTITVRDVIAVTNSATTIVNNICPTVTVTVTNGLCGVANASIVAAGANGTPPYQYSIDGINFQPNSGFTGLSSGNYTIIVKDEMD